MKVVERLLENLKPTIAINNQNIQIAGSIGIALYPDNAEDLDELVLPEDQVKVQGRLVGLIRSY